MSKSRPPPPLPPNVPSISSSATVMYTAAPSQRPPLSSSASSSASSSPPDSRRSSSSASSAASAPSPSVSTFNHSSRDRSTPAAASQRPSLHFEGDSMDGSYSFVISAPASAGSSPAMTPVGDGVGGISAAMERASLDGRSGAPGRAGPPPLPTFMRPNTSPPLRPESPRAPPPPSAAPLLGFPSSAQFASAPFPSSGSAAVAVRRGDERPSEEAQTVKFYLKQAIQAKDAVAIASLLEKADKLHVDAELLRAATAFLAEKRVGDVNTLSFYLKHSIESKNREGLKMALEKITPLIDSLEPQSRAAHPDLLALVEDARRLSVALDEESAQTVHYYLKQGIQLRNRDVIKQSLEKTPSVPPQLLDKDLTSAAHDVLAELDAQHLTKFYLTTAIEQRQELALEQALEQAKKLRMGGDVAEVTEGYKLLAELRAKGAKKGRGGGGGRWKSPAERSNGAKARAEPRFVLFGGPLLEAVRRSDRPIPALCAQCMDFLRAHALTEPGLFRVAGNKDAIDALRAQYEDGDGEVKLEDVHDVAGVFKLYLRMLPEPLIPYVKYDAFIRTGMHKDKGKNSIRNAELREQVAQLPPENYALLSSLVRFLVEVAKNSEINRMTPENLAMVFAPNLIRPAQETANTMLYDMPVAIATIAAFILFTDEIFTQPPVTAVPQSLPQSAAASSSSSVSSPFHVSTTQSAQSAVGQSLSSTLPGPVSVSTSSRKVIGNQTL